MTACSWNAGWRSLLLRAYDDPPAVEEFSTPPTADHLIVLVTDGSCDIEGRYRGRWSRAHYQAGGIGMTAPGHEVTLRWRGETRHRTLQLHLPAATIRAAIEELSDRDASLLAMPSRLISHDPLIENHVVACGRDGRRCSRPLRGNGCADVDRPFAFASRQAWRAAGG
jgi:AraC family transcriptional regulator